MEKDEKIPSDLVPASAYGSSELVHLEPLQMYMQEVRRYPLLDPEEEHRLAVAVYEQGDADSARRMVTGNLRLVVKIAFEYKKAYRNVMDLIQEGNIGLLMAVKKFDPYRGVKFSSYAAWWIKAYILRYVLNNWRLVKIGTTQTQRKLFFNLHKEKHRLESMGFEADPGVIAERLDVEEGEVVEMDRRLQASEVSLDAPVGDDSGRTTTRLDMLEDGSQPRADDLVALARFNSELSDRLAEFGKGLTGKEAEIFGERLMSGEPVTLQDIADRHGITRERVRQIEARLLRKLKEFLKSDMPGWFDEEFD